MPSPVAPTEKEIEEVKVGSIPSQTPFPTLIPQSPQPPLIFGVSPNPSLVVPWGRTTTLGASISENIEGPGQTVDVDVESPKHLPNGAIDGEIKKNQGQKKRKKSKALRPPIFPDGRPELIEFGEEEEVIKF